MRSCNKSCGQTSHLWRWRGILWKWKGHNEQPLLLSPSHWYLCCCCSPLQREEKGQPYNSTASRACVSPLQQHFFTQLKFVNVTKLSGEVDPLERRDVLQEHLDRLEEWASKNFMNFNKDKCKVLHLGKHDPGVQHRLGSPWMESSCVEGPDGQAAQYG